MVREASREQVGADPRALQAPTGWIPRGTPGLDLK